MSLPWLKEEGIDIEPVSGRTTHRRGHTTRIEWSYNDNNAGVVIQEHIEGRKTPNKIHLTRNQAEVLARFIGGIESGYEQFMRIARMREDAQK